MSNEHLCKLTEPGGYAHGGFQWPLPHDGHPGEWVRTSGEGPLCSPGWIHLYTHPLLAVALNPIHANFLTPAGWEVDVSGKQLTDHGIKLGVTECRLVRRLELPVIPTTALVRWAIQLSLLVNEDADHLDWATDWLSGADRSSRAAWAAVAVAEAAEAEAARVAAARAAEERAAAARAAEERAAVAWAAEARAAEARAAEARLAAWAAVAAARAVVEAARAAVAARASIDLPLVELLEQAVADEAAMGMGEVRP